MDSALLSLTPFCLFPWLRLIYSREDRLTLGPYEMCDDVTWSDHRPVSMVMSLHLNPLPRTSSSRQQGPTSVRMVLEMAEVVVSFFVPKPALRVDSQHGGESGEGSELWETTGEVQEAVSTLGGDKAGEEVVKESWRPRAVTGSEDEEALDVKVDGQAPTSPPSFVTPGSLDRGGGLSSFRRSFSTLLSTIPTPLTNSGIAAMTSATEVGQLQSSPSSSPSSLAAMMVLFPIPAESITKPKDKRSSDDMLGVPHLLGREARKEGTFTRLSTQHLCGSPYTM